VSNLLDGRSGDEMLSAPGGVAAVIEDRSDTWSHGVYRFQDQVGAFEVESVRRVASGPVLSTIRVESRFEASRLRQDYTLFHGPGLVVVDVRVDWHQRWQALKLRWPVAVEHQRAT
jgi:alpha-mannosidase